MVKRYAAIREIYKNFEIAVKEGGAKAVMSSFNYIGTQGRRKYIRYRQLSFVMSGDSVDLY